MSSTSETGHARNAAAFEQLISFCTGYATRYHPSRVALSVGSLTTQLAQCRAALTATSQAESLFDNATRARMLAYDPLRPLATKAMNALSASDVSDQAIANARTIMNKLQNHSSKSKTQKAAPATPETTATPVKTISTSQASYDQQAEHFNSLIQLLSTEAAYVPNEPELQLNALRNTLATLHTMNTNVISAYTQWSNARLYRDQLMYNPLSGLVTVAQGVKKYVKSVFGATSAEYGQVSGLEIKTVKL